MKLVALSLIATVAAKYSSDRATEYAKLAGAAYCSASVLPSWTCGDFCDDMSVSKVQVCQGHSTIAYVGVWERKGLVSFRGSHGVSSFITDLEQIKSGVPYDSCSGCETASGFLKEWLSLEDCIQSSLKSVGQGPRSKIRITGHSLGASLAELAMVGLDDAGWKIDESYHFGTPRTGNTPFAQYVSGKFNQFRVTHHRDPVPQLPLDSFLIINFGYEHTVPEYFYDGKVSKGYEVCTTVHQHDCGTEMYWNVAIDALNVGDHLHYMDLAIAACPGGTPAANFTVVV